MIRYVFALLVAASMFFQVQPVFSQSAEEFKALKDEVTALKAGQEGIKKDIQDIKAQLKAKPAPAEFKETVVNVEGDPSKGSKDAKLALIEFSDYQ
jgi:hypothetical protein